MLYNRNINWTIDRNLTIIEDLGINSSISVIEEMLIEGEEKKW